MDTYGLVGYPLSHSFSKKFFSQKFHSEQINAQYLNFEIPSIDELPEVIAKYPSLKGINVTIPHKESILPLLSEVHPEAAAIGAVNTVKIHRIGRQTQLIGYNTDYDGFRESILPLVPEVQTPYKALILGTGGASKAVMFALKQLGIICRYVSRKKQNNLLTYQQIDENIIREHTIIINTTPLGTFPNVDELPDIPYQYLSSTHLLYDLVYNPSETAFMREGRLRGCRVKNGEEMLHIQALRAWSIWNNSI